jgi:hypothetical protein
MIIKSMSRRQATFAQLIDYMEDGRQDRDYSVKNNLFTQSPEGITQEFEHNAEFFKKRKDSVYMYHEIISITHSPQLSNTEHKDILRNIVGEYIRARANNNLVYGVLHQEKDNFHYHLLISSNELENTKKHRLSKKEFSTIKKELEIMVVSTYPELQQGLVINQPAQENISHKAYATQKRTGKPNQRETLKNMLQGIFDTTDTKQNFFEKLAQEQLEIYVRGKTVGIKDQNTGRKYRLSTLGLLSDFEKISSIIEKQETTAKEQASTQDNFQEKRTPYPEKISIKSHSSSPPEPDSKEANIPLTDTEKEIERRKELLREARKQQQEQEKNNPSPENEGSRHYQ